MQILRTATADTTTWTATIDGVQVACLSVWTANGEIAEVETATAHRGQGHATALYHHADADFGGIFHTVEAHRTEDGDAFAARVGGNTIHEADARHIDVCDHCTGADSDYDNLMAELAA